MTPMYGSSEAPPGAVGSAGYVFEMYALKSLPRAVSTGLMAPLLTQLLTMTGSVGPGAVSGRSVPAAMPLAIWFVESRLVVMWTLTPLVDSKGARTSLNALSSAPPQAVQTVTSVVEAPPPPVFPPPPPHAAMRNNAPRQNATSRELRLAKTSVIACSPPYPDPALGRKLPPFRPAPRPPPTRPRPATPTRTGGGGSTSHPRRAVSRQATPATYTTATERTSRCWPASA